MIKYWRILIFIFAAFAVSGCTSDKMLALDVPPAVIQTPQADKVTMVVFRSSYFGGAVQSSVFDITTGEPEFVGILSAGKKIAYIMPPGRRRLMVVGENASFLDVTGSLGKTYFARVSPRFGLWKARFVLEPVPGSDKELEEEIAKCAWVENTSLSKEWARENTNSIISKMRDYIEDWESKEDRETLLPEDGV